MKTLDIVLVNRNSGPLLKKCLTSLEKSVLCSTSLRSVSVVDNASADDSAEDLHVLLPITIYNMATNTGFSAACNRAARCGYSDYLLFLNPDIALYPYTIESALDALSQNEDAGLLGIHLTDERDKPQLSRMVFPKPRHFYSRAFGLSRYLPRRCPTHFSTDQSESGTADCVLGAFLLVKRYAFEQVGGFDESFFLYFEEIDLAKRLKASGWRCLYRADILAQHVGGCGESANNPFRIEQSIRSRLLYAKRYFSPASYRLLRLFSLRIEPLLRAIYALFKGGSPSAVLAAYRKATHRRQGESTPLRDDLGWKNAGAAR